MLFDGDQEKVHVSSHVAWSLLILLAFLDVGGWQQYSANSDQCNIRCDNSYNNESHLVRALRSFQNKALLFRPKMLRHVGPCFTIPQISDSSRSDPILAREITNFFRTCDLENLVHPGRRTGSCFNYMACIQGNLFTINFTCNVFVQHNEMKNAE